MATVVSVNPSNRQAGTYPFDAGTVPAGIEAAVFTLTLTTADKLSVGKTISWRFEESVDGVVWTLVAEGGWTSYGPGGLTFIDPRTGQTVTNPDPYLSVPLSARAGKRLRGSVTLGQTTRVGVVIEIV
jgi:hypothetical protein